MNILGYIFVFIGALFYALGGLGMFRMPDVFNRLQAGTKATTLGTIALLFGIGLLNPDWMIKILLIIVFLTVTNPVGSSTLARAAYISNVKKDVEKDELKSLLNGDDEK
ncbi:monovalent cation/H(+) antiporter subunit G [Geotoga petraea]|jgi:multicomponent Na+:H+ antiporter subunit G|uniref:Membrane bound protein complex subunit mbxC n=1 Tax=Geotoga petraea TaxID=28234 RepID=A0A1G6P5B8_9BACT|nr:monovalent cation/H(+) antiporter subunit G [Geotoga petraea]TGG87889.1 monovalent cation/H(+) antiporter subunit G [Geotoga petraea]SDC74686.1 Membrane bound protein complex subunit mbxC [Geotoga petraea]